MSRIPRLAHIVSNVLVVSPAIDFVPIILNYGFVRITNVVVAASPGYDPLKLAACLAQSIRELLQDNGLAVHSIIGKTVRKISDILPFFTSVHRTGQPLKICRPDKAK